MTIHNGDLIITSGNVELCGTLTQVTGSLHVFDPATFPMLKKVDGALFVFDKAAFPALSTVGCALDVQDDATFPLLTHVNGSVNVLVDATFSDLTTVGGWLEVNATATFPSLKTVGGALYVRADAIFPLLDARMLANDDNFQLWVVDGEYRAGCRRFTREQALKHWDKPTARANLFTAAILGE